MNIKEVEFRGNDQELLEIDLKLNFAFAGPKLGKSISEVKNIIDKLDYKETEKLLEENSIQLTLNSDETFTLTMNDLLVEKKGINGFKFLEGSKFSALLDTKLTQELKEEGVVREFVRAVQTFRKELDLPVDLRVNLYVQTDTRVQAVLIKFNELVKKNLIINTLNFESKQNMKSFNVEGEEIKLYIKA